MNREIMIGEPAPEQQLKPVEFVKLLVDGNMEDASNYRSSNYKVIECIARNYQSGFDLLFAHAGDRNDPLRTGLFLGHLNDGVY